MADALVRDALDATADRPLILEGFPGNRKQAAAVHVMSRSRSRPLTVVELTAHPDTLAERPATRRVCTGCDPDPDDPRHPAQVEPTRPDRCGACGTELTRRGSDEGEKAAARLARYEDCAGRPVRPRRCAGPALAPHRHRFPVRGYRLLHGWLVVSPRIIRPLGCKRRAAPASALQDVVRGA
ncbi:hypothetical protein [Streptomyces spectabilis]|uniref:hypothetical protein n=1 Tax=Streptomyces spectabilis TaxID=68270 RepID=UPI003558D470